MRVVSGSEVTLEDIVRNPAKAPAVVVTLVVEGSRVEQRILQPSTDNPDVFRTTWTLASRTQPMRPADAVPLSGRGTFSVSAAMSATATQAPNDRQLRTAYATASTRATFRCSRHHGRASCTRVPEG